MALPGITVVSPKLLEAFGENRSYLDPSGLQNLDLTQAKALCRPKDSLHLWTFPAGMGTAFCTPGGTTESRDSNFTRKSSLAFWLETAQALRDGLRALILPNLSQLDPAATNVIAQTQSSISPPCIQQLTVEQAKTLAHSKTRELEFRNIADLRTEVAAALIDRQPVMVGESSQEPDESPLPHFSKMTFHGLKRVQQHASEILSRTSCCRFSSFCIEELTPQVAKLLTHYEEGVHTQSNPKQRLETTRKRMPFVYPEGIKPHDWAKADGECSRMPP